MRKHFVRFFFPFACKSKDETSCIWYFRSKSFNNFQQTTPKCFLDIVIKFSFAKWERCKIKKHWRKICFNWINRFPVFFLCVQSNRIGVFKTVFFISAPSRIIYTILLTVLVLFEIENKNQRWMFRAIKRRWFSFFFFKYN